MLGSMASGFKHFSHTHNLVMHEMPEGAEVSCSGCHSSATKTVYVCSQCGFYLHEQCFHATRSRKHPSHPMHPLTLVPFPTYPSNTFYCNSCKVIGTGFSYSCSDCDFDLHVQCAYSIYSATNFHQPNLVTSPYNPHNNSYPNQEIALPILPNVPSISFPTPIQIPIPTQIPVHAQYPINSTLDSYLTQNVSTFSLPTSAQNMYISQNSTSAPISAQISSIPQNGSLVFAQTNAPNSDSSSNYVESAQTWPKSQGIRHFSHPHGLVLVNIKHGKKKITCSGCQETIVGKGYACVEQNCWFQIHESCFNLEKEIQHKSHPPHPLTFVSSSKEKGMLTCNACFKDCTAGFNYHCSICDYDLHVKCAILKETVKREDHEHELKLFYECPLKGEEYTFFCDVCNRVVPRDHWTYYCKECDFGTHLDCVNREECDGTNGDDVVDAVTMQMLEKMMDTARINAFSDATGLKY